MKKHLISTKDFFKTASRLSISRITALLVVILCFGISTSWAAKPGTILYVNASAAANGDGKSWGTAFTDLQSALYAAASGDEIWVAAGTYTPTSKIAGSSDPRMAAFILKSGVKIYGGFIGDENQLHKRQMDPSLTILSGDIGTPGDDTDNSYHVVYADGVTGAVLDGFTVTGGRGEGSSWSYKGAGMYNYNSSLTVANCTFRDNRVAVTSGYADGYGGGMYNYNSAPVVQNCTFSANKAGNASIFAMGHGGGMYNEGYFGTVDSPQWPVITGCTFSDNVASGSSSGDWSDGGGGGMLNFDSSPTVDSCTFEGNSAKYGGGMLNYDGAQPIITNCIFTANFTITYTGFGGAIFNAGSGPKILNCTFYKNGWRLLPSGPEPRFRPDVWNGGAIYDFRSRSLIANTLFVENAVISQGGAIYSYRNPYGWPTLFNCLFFENIRWAPFDATDKDQEINHVVGTVSSDSVNNLFDIDPLLVDPAGGDFHLRYDSPAIDAGTTKQFAKLNWLPMPVKDFYGNPRIVDGDGDGVAAADIGVHEFIPNLPDLRAFLQALADSGSLDGATAARLISYVDNAQAALDQDATNTAINILEGMIVDVQTSIGGTDIGQVIVQKTQAVINNLG